MINFFNNINFSLDMPNNIKIIETKNVDLFIRDLMQFEIKNNQKSILLNDEIKISINETIILDYLTKIFDLVASVTKNWLVDNIANNENWNNSLILNQNKLNNIVADINHKLGFKYIDIDIDNTKLIKSIFAINQSIFLNRNNYLKILDFLASMKSKNLIIIKDLDYIKINEIAKYSNFNFLILTNDLTKYINKYNQLNLASFYQNNLLIDIQSNIPIIHFFENKKNQEIDENEFLFTNETEKNQFKFDFFQIKRSFFK